MPTPRILAAVVACALAAPANSRERPGPTGETSPVEGFVALRAGVAVPAGDARARVPMGDLVSGAIPLGLELAARGGTTTVGLLLEYAPALAARCPQGVACSGAVTRAGVELLRRFSSAPGGSGWVGGGIGWEGTSVTVAGRTTRVDSLELLNLQAGRDFAVGRALVGPFVAATIAQGMQQDGKDIQQKGSHAWMQVGVRVELTR